MNFFLNFKSLFEKKDYNKIIIIIFLILAVTFAEILGIAAIIPFITVILAPERFENIEFMKFFVTINSYNHNQKLIIFSVIFFSIYLLKNIFIIFSNKFIYQFIYSFKEKTFIKLLELYLHQKFSFYNKKTFTEISNNLLNEVGQVATNYVRPILSLVSELTICLSIILLAIALGFYNIFFIALIFILCVSIILKILNKKIKALSQQRVKSNEGIMQLIFEFILGIKEIILSGNPFGLIKKLKDNQIHLKKIDINIDVLRLIPKSILEVFVILSFLMAVIYLNRINTPPSDIFVILGFYLAAAYRILPSLNIIFISYQSIKFSKASLAKIQEDLKLQKEIVYLQKDKKLSFAKNILLKHVTFKYNNDIILKDINLTINKKEVVGICGTSGSGKSTLLNIISNLYEPTSGELLIDNHKLNNAHDVRLYQNLLSYISQDTFLINDSLKNNIIFGTTGDFNEQKFLAAIQFACLDSFLNSLKDGSEAKISLISKNISTGQKQRIALARSYYNDKDILIFDEATNALDEENEKKIIQNIIQLKQQGKTIIIVSHNESNLFNCDKVYKINNNGIVSIK
tara:strand:- start:1742 stop:3460 length:1719 start_codon:yes stop_codon:yes gene_type:complete